ncbi:MAG TPA: hypothetical protein VN843_01995 [Anaerolineales bacterium]|nr:hypothetical protein [Anaerolineales bacterium]
MGKNPAKPIITIEELSQLVAQRELKRAQPDLDQARETRMAKLREKYPDGLRAIEHMSKRPIQARHIFGSRFSSFSEGN